MAAAPTTAPSFGFARQVLADLFGNWTFAAVTKPCMIPVDEAPSADGHVKHYFGTAEERSPTDVRGSRRRVFFQKVARHADAFWVGPAVVLEPAELPQPGDMLVGLAEPNTGPSKAGRIFGGLKYTSWQAGARPAWELARIVTLGTSLSEAALQHALRTKTAGGADEMWAVARVVLFGNLRAFHPSEPPTMALRKPPSAFVHECAIRFSDPSIWTHYASLFPEVLRPPPPPAGPPAHRRPPAASTNTIQPLVLPSLMPPPPHGLSPHGLSPDQLFARDLHVKHVRMMEPSPYAGAAPRTPPDSPPPQPSFEPSSPPYAPMAVDSIPELPELPELPPPQPPQPPPPAAALLTLQNLRELLQAVSAPPQPQPPQYDDDDDDDDDDGVEVLMSRRG